MRHSLLFNNRTYCKLIKASPLTQRLARPMDYDYLDLLINSFTYLRKYTPVLLSKLEFHTTQATEPVLRALNVLREINENKKRQVPEGAPLDFVPKRWQKHVYNEDLIVSIMN